MPLYEYQCEHCGQRFEVIQKFSDAPPAVCRKCGGGPVQKLLSSPAIQFKGSGFYLTDYGRGTGSKADGAGKAGKSDKAEGGGGASTEGATKSDSASGGESKPASTADTSSAKSTPAAKAD